MSYAYCAKSPQALLSVTRATSTQAVAAGYYARIQFNSENFDVGGNYDTTTYEFTTPDAGYYVIAVNIEVTATDGSWTTGNRVVLRLRVSGSTNPIAESEIRVTGTDASVRHISLVTLAYLQLGQRVYAEISDVDDAMTISNTASANQMSIAKMTESYSVKAKASRTDSLQTIESAAFDGIEYNREYFDPGEDFSTTDYLFTVPDTGYYLIAFGLRTVPSAGAWTASDVLEVKVLNGATVLANPKLALNGTDATARTIGFSTLAYLTAADEITVEAKCSGSDFWIPTGQQYNSFAIARVSETYAIKVKATRETTDQTITHGSYTVVQLNGETFDADTDFDAYTLTAPATGYYWLDAGVNLIPDATAWTTAGSVVARLRKGGATTLIEGMQKITTVSATDDDPRFIPLSGLFYLTSGDTVTLEVYSTADDVIISKGQELTWFSARRLA